jgi:hypothetical protein
MPNWCENTLEVWGDEKELKEFKEKTIKGSEFIMGELLPLPEDQKDNWYDWNVANYGTKWDEMDIYHLTEDEEQLQVQFSSAWSPPCEFIQNIYKKFPNLSFKLKYDEPGMGFFGVTTAGDGDFRDSCGDY